ncbi:hypothetical protein EG68_05811 [Paragonimus skrjabini miyazakii]|uniref:CCR4-NOT transcription complex subunit 1 n=1 Tax=Paragonimus skrjabini miyazakii TaxID=59628 RepID=A0A8S9Y8K8_9TREM|nr:hypothetical protein EG68_05811 [Paragonimus skrjabini miyazakii]
MLGSDNLALSLLHIESLVCNAGKKTHKANFAEIHQLIEQHRPIAEQHFVRCLFSSIDFSPYETKSAQKDFHQTQYLSQEFNSILSKPNFPSLLCYAVDRPLPSVKGFGPSRHILSQISRVLKLSRVQEVALGLAFTQSSSSQIVYYAKQWIRLKLPELVQAHLTAESVDGTSGSLAVVEDGSGEFAVKPTDSRTPSCVGVLHEVSIEMLHFILGHMLEDNEHYGVSKDTLSMLLSLLCRDSPRDRVPVVLSAFLYSDIVELSAAKAFGCETNLLGLVHVATTVRTSSANSTLLSLDYPPTGASGKELMGDNGNLVDTIAFDESAADASLIADLLEELGYACTRTLDTMRLTLAEFTQREISPAAVAQCLCLLMRTADGRLGRKPDLDDTPDHRSRSAELAEEETLMILQVGGSGALWREATGTGSSARPSSLILSSSTIRERGLTGSSSESRLMELGHVKSHLDGGTVGIPMWNLDNFLTVVFELNPNLTMNQIISELDCPQFFVSSRSAFQLLKQFLLHDAQPKLPVNLFYRPWVHAHGQLSLLRSCCNFPDVICLAYWPHRSVDLSLYRLNQTEEQAQTQIWKNVDYVQALLSLSERGLFSHVYTLLKHAFSLCPDILTATLFETAPNTVRSIMLGHAFVYYLTPRLNSQVVLQTAWNGCKKNHLSSADLQQQKFLLLAASVECTAQLIAGVPEPTTLPDVSVENNPPVQSSLTRLVELLAAVSDTTSTYAGGVRASSLLPILLGTPESASNAVCVLLSTTSNAFPVSSHLLPSPVHAIDLALVLLVRIANAVSLAASRSAPEASSSITSMQNAIRVFLLQWFTECLRDKEVSESFAYGVVDHLRTRYGSCVIGTTSVLPSHPATQMTALPPELRNPSVALLTRIIQSALAALKSTTCCLRPNVLKEVTQTLTLYLQNLSVGVTNGSGSSQLTSRVGASPAPSAFGLAMKPSGGPGHTSGSLQAQPPTHGQQQSQQTRISASGLHLPYQSSEFNAAALASTGTFNSNTDEAFSRSSAVTSFAGRLNQPLGSMMQHGPPPLPGQRKPSDGMSSQGLHFPMDHQPVALSFSNEPIKIEMSKEAEAEAYGFFQKLLKNISTPDEMFKTVCEYATQGTLAQRKLLDGILRMLADEVSQYLPDYPERMLPLIADLYGNILATSTQLLSIRALSMLWRALLTRLHSLTPEAADTPLFRALILILIKAKNTFTQFYNLPTCLINCPVFKVFPHDLQEYILNVEIYANNYLRSQQTGSAGSKSLGVGSGTGFHPANQLFSSHQASTPTSCTSVQQITGLTLYPTQPEPSFKPPDPPEEAITDRIYFLFNNVSQSNAKEKSAELADLLAEDRIIPWFAFYLVGKRVPVEHTFHELFAGVLDQIQERVPDVRPKVMQELIRNVKLLLRNMRKDRDDMQARTTLKNLGNFLGLITLARNKPLLHDDLNVKDLIYEAYHKGPISSQYVIPFVARVVRGAANSIVFRPPNPWTMGILRVFREFYELKDVKDCLRFEIELLYRNFTLNLEDVDMMDFLRNRNHAANLEVQLCFFVPPETLITSVPSVTSSAAALTSGVDSTAHTTVSSMANTGSDILPSPVPSQQQQMLNVLAAFQLQQQQVATGPQTTTTVVDSAISTTNVTQPVYSASGFDLAGMMQAAGASGSSSSSTRALMLAALAANQSQKQLSQQPVGQSFSVSNTGTPSNASTAAAAAAFSLQQKQLAATMAALQQQQQLQSQHMFTAPGLAPQTSTAAVVDSTVEVPGGSLRYEDVSVRSIRACLNLDDLIAAAAAASNRAGGPTAGGNNVTQAAIALLQSNPRLRNLIEPAITRAINELTTPVFERCARITVTTVAAVVRKDFALDPDPGRLLYAAHQMVRHLAAGMSLITAREALGMSLVTALKNIFLAEVQSASGQEKEAVQRLATLVVAKSMHTCLGFMQKSVAEKAVKDVERKLEPDVKLRTELGPRRFLEQATSQLAAQQANMPESLRLTVGGPSPLEMSVYEEFGRVIPGFAPSSATSVPSTSSLGLNVASLGQPTSPNAAAAQVAAYLHQQQQDLNSVSRMQRQMSASGSTGVPLLKPLIGPTSTQQQLLLQQQQQAPITSLLDKIIAQIERHMAFISSRLCSTTDPMIRSLRGLVDAVHLAKTSRDANVAVTVIGIMVRSFLEHYRPSMWRDQPRGLETMEHLKEAHMLTLRHMLSSDQAWVTRQVTQTWIHLDEGSVNKDRSSLSVPGGSENCSTEASSKSVGESSVPASTNITDKPSSAESGGDASWSGWKSGQSDITRTEIGSVDGSGLHSIKWNWEAFAELLKIHVIYLSQADSYLAQEVATGHPGAIMFVIDLLDHFVLPCPAGTSVGAAAAAAASFARANVNPVIAISGASSGVAQVSGSTASANAVTVSYPSTSIPQPPASQLKREFTVLNEYDLWSTLEAMRARVGYLNTAVATRSANLTDPLGLRLRLACARVCGLLDLGLLEQSPLFYVTPGTSNPISALYAGCSQAREFDDPPNLQEKVELLMRNWVEIYQSPRQRDPATIEAMCSQLVQIGVLPNMDNLTRFLRLATIFVIERALKPLKQHDQQQPAMLGMPPGTGGGSASVPLSSLIGGSNMGANMSLARVAAYVELDAYARLISIIVRRSGGEQSDHSNSKITLLNKVLGIIAGTLLQEHEVRRDCFHPMPFERILIMLFVELHSTSPPVPTLDVSGEDSVEQSHPPNGEAPSEKTPTSATVSTKANWPRGRSNLTLQQQLPLVFCHLLHCLRPEKATAFVFSWLEMLAHRWFVGRILAAPGPPQLRAAYQAMYAQLLVDLLKFLGYFLQNALMPKPIQCLYKATLRLFLVLIHDFPEFVSDYYALFCDVVPSNSIQMRNLILSALPKRGIPSTDPLQAPPVDNLASLEDPTGYCMEAGSRLPEPMRCELDAYLATRAPVKLLSELVTMLRRADDVLPPIPPTHFAYHPQQQARHQQALAAYAAALAANNSGVSIPVSSTTSSKNDGKTNIEDVGSAENSQTTKKSTGDSSNTHESTDITDSSEQTVLRPTTGTTSSSAAAAALLWGVRATQQLATFGLADGMHYNVELMTNLTLYLCITAIRCLREKGMPLNMSTIAHTPQMDIIQSLVLNLDNEGRYLLLNCMANQLRYPNSHTYYFSYTILYLFSEQSKEQVKEQISRVLMERLIVNRPHPWGLLMTSAELLRNPAYRFWEHEFARCNPEIEAIVTIVARSCIPNFQLSNVSGPSGLRTSSATVVSASGASSAVAAGDRRRQASPLTRRSPTVTDACANAIRTPRALNSFIPG